MVTASKATVTMTPPIEVTLPVSRVCSFLAGCTAFALLFSHLKPHRGRCQCCKAWYLSTVLIDRSWCVSRPIVMYSLKNVIRAHGCCVSIVSLRCYLPIVVLNGKRLTAHCALPNLDYFQSSRLASRVIAYSFSPSQILEMCLGFMKWRLECFSTSMWYTNVSCLGYCKNGLFFGRPIF